jgi:F420-non-reducing hydrogenase iron-sulfur subunit
VKEFQIEEMELRPAKIVAYHCRNLRLFQNGNQKTFARSMPGLSLVAIPCSGKLEAHHLLKTLASGAEGVLILACAENACQYMEGSRRSHKRTDYARAWLEKLGIETGRLRFVHLAPGDRDGLEAALKEFAMKLETFGTIPTIAQSQAR